MSLLGVYNDPRLYQNSLADEQRRVKEQQAAFLYYDVANDRMRPVTPVLHGFDGACEVAQKPIPMPDPGNNPVLLLTGDDQ